MGLRGLIIYGTRKDQGVVGYLARHAAVGIIVHPARSAVVERNPRQAVEVVVCEDLFQVTLVVGSRG